MIERTDYLRKVQTALGRSPITALLGPRQCGKTTLAREIAGKSESIYLDMESVADRRRLTNPELAFSQMHGLVILDEIQSMPELFPVLKNIVDQPDNAIKFLILGSASPVMIRSASESLAGRVEFVDLHGFCLTETGPEHWESLWLRGGFPRSYLAKTEEDSAVWREGFIRTFLERDIPQLGITIPAAAIRRFWTMLAHYHGQTWNASEISRSMGLTDKTIRSYLDILTGTYLIRQIQPWYENVGKRQVKAPKIYFQDTGLLHSLLDIPDLLTLFGHPKVGASWEGFAIEQILRVVQPSGAYFWGTHSGAEIDLVFNLAGKRLGVEVKFNDAPTITASMRIAAKDLDLDHLWVVYPGKESYPLAENISTLPITRINEILTG